MCPSVCPQCLQWCRVHAFQATAKSVNCWYCTQGSSNYSTLTDLLRRKQCQKYFTVLWGPKGTQPNVIADLAGLMSRHQLPYAEQLLQRVQAVCVHPNDDAWHAILLHNIALMESVSRRELPAGNPKVGPLYYQCCSCRQFS